MKRTNALPRPAYIDGGLAAFLGQAAVAGLLGSLLYVKVFWRKVKAFFGGAPAEQPKEEPRP